MQVNDTKDDQAEAKHQAKARLHAAGASMVIAIFKDDSREEFVRTSATVLYNSTLDAVRKGFEEKKNRQFDEFNEEYMRRFIALARLYQVGRIPF